MQIEISNLSYTYNENSPFEKKALQNVSFTIEQGKYVAVVGQTGSGKSTLVQHINGLLLPTEGSIKVGTMTIEPKTKKKTLKPLRRKVGYVFQNPEQQLFEETVEKEVLFGLHNFGYSNREATRRAHEALSLVGINASLYKVSPFQLSGGQMRRVAIASVLAFEPQVLILDEPTAGLDPIGKREIMDLFATYKDEKQATIILVTHQMEDVATYANEVIIMQNGKLIEKKHPQEIFHNEQLINDVQLDVPEAITFMKKYEQKINANRPFAGLTMEDAADFIQGVILRKE
jgi:energy-coupling factor transport system ATP-binding protein